MRLTPTELQFQELKAKSFCVQNGKPFIPIKKRESLEEERSRRLERMQTSDEEERNHKRKKSDKGDIPKKKHKTHKM